jgi:hypothetical protein
VHAEPVLRATPRNRDAGRCAQITTCALSSLMPVLNEVTGTRWLQCAAVQYTAWRLQGAIPSLSCTTLIPLTVEAIAAIGRALCKRSKSHFWKVVFSAAGA